MELRQLHQFIAVAEMNSFSRAAERLHIAQPALSVAIRKLEGHIGVALFERGARGVRLTAAGEAALVVARRCLHSVEDLVSSARMANQGDAGTLRVGFVGSATLELLPRIIEAFSDRYPKVRLDLFESTNNDLLQAVAAEDLHIALVRCPTATPSGVLLQVIEKDVFCAAVPAKHPLSKRKSIRMRDLAKEPFVSYSPSRASTLHTAVVRLMERAGILPQVAQEGVQVQTVIGLVASGLGVALVPSIHARRQTSRVAFVPIEALPAGSALGLAIAYRDHSETLLATRFREIAGTLR